MLIPLLRRDRLGFSEIYAFFQFFPDLEEREFFRFDVDNLAGLWVSALVSIIAFDFKTSKSPDFDSIPLDECLFHAFESGIHRNLSLFNGYSFSFG